MAEYTGTLRAKTRVVVAPKIAGRLNQLKVDIGDKVRSGQLLAVLEDEEYHQQVIQAEANLKVAEATLNEAKSLLSIAERNFARARNLHKTGVQSDAELDKANSAYQSQLARFNVAEAQLANRKAALANARVRLSYTRIRASWDRGSPLRYVGERFADEGSLLATNRAILSIIELEPIIAVINVTDQEYFRLKTGQPATITSSAFSGKVFTGRILRIAPMLQETSRQARVEIEVDNKDLLLKPGMFINARIEFSQKDNITIVPYNAVAKREGKQGIFLVDVKNKRARFQAVETGIIEKDRVEIVKPAGISGYVVVMGHYLLESEGRVILPDISPEAPAGKIVQ
jgi:RND family efflux transporter MFP subunit